MLGQQHSQVGLQNIMDPGKERIGPLCSLAGDCVALAHHLQDKPAGYTLLVALACPVNIAETS